MLAQPAANAAARGAKWRQLVDLLAQRRDHLPSREVDEALAFLRLHRGEIDGRVRKDIARALSGRRVSPLLIRFFGEDHPAIATPIISTARLSADEWLDVLPAMSPTARALLRHRRDLPSEVTQALGAFGSSDFVLSGTIAPEAMRVGGASLNPATEGGEAQIRELVARIEAFREEKQRAEAEGERDEAAIARSAIPQIESFRWETGADGVIVWVEDAPRGPLIGQTIAVIADRGHFGVDGQAAGAFEKRAPFRDARFSVVGAGAVSGDWRISGVPFFDPRRGSFLGYRGSARRPRVDEVARARSTDASPSGLFGTDVSADALRQLIHELRTPLNAIVGFAELFGTENRAMMITKTKRLSMLRLYSVSQPATNSPA
ncbi:MAG: histidine kinase [Alphaproteobacteria bacterium]|nr:histidine kinase [Alphaproteobacteria bacterium]